MNILLTGGAGYIGSHIAVALTDAGHRISIVDNFVNSVPEAIVRVEKITGKNIVLHKTDVTDREDLTRILHDEKPDCVIHCAGLKSVGESVKKPLKYYRNNINTTLSLLESMKETGIERLVFSSSATVYGEDNIPPFTETMPKGRCANPYGWTKWMQEQIIEDVVKQLKISTVILRYFNPTGAHKSGLIGEEPNGLPNNLMPYILQVADGRREHLTVFGDDYNTPDGTCRRDYIHVMDLAEAHLKAAEYVEKNKGLDVFNIGRGIPCSVLELVKAFEEASEQTIKYEIGSRRDGDVQDIWADTSKAEEVLGWQVHCGIKEMCQDAWNWQKKNPAGYAK